jgi:nitroreductase
MPFLDQSVPAELRGALIDAARTEGVAAHPVAGIEEAAALAVLLDHAGLVLRQDQAYQRELALWTNTIADHRPGGLPRARLTWDTLPWAGLVRASTSLPDAGVLASRLGREYLLVLHTTDDGPLDHVRAGQAVQRIWLAATHAGLAGSVITQPLQVPEVRAGLIEQLDLPGFPHAVLRLGYPARPVPPAPRMPVADLLG